MRRLRIERALVFAMLSACSEGTMVSVPGLDATSGLGTDARASDGASPAGRDAADIDPVDGGSLDAISLDSGAPDADRPDAAPAMDGGTLPGTPRLPIMIAASNYARFESQLSAHGPFMLYAWATNPALQNPMQYDRELSTLANIQAPDVEKWIMFSSHVTLAQKLAAPGHLAELQALGLHGVGFNSEGMMTPTDEMDSLGSPDPGVNAVARFSSLATGAGLRILWGPIRITADNVPDGAVAAMFSEGLDGVGLQEQRFIEAACVSDRSSAVRASAQRYRTLGGADTHVNVQVMPSRCIAGDSYSAQQCGVRQPVRFGHCLDFLEDISGDIDSIAIWASGGSDTTDLVPLVEAIRQRGL